MIAVKISKVNKDLEEVDELIEFIKNCSWLEVKDHVLEMVRNWVFIDWEAIFIAKADGKIVGITTVMKEDYYPLPDLFPWISTIFVEESFRGNRISEKLIGFANNYLKDLGFTRSYIPSEHIGLYEKYGYEFLKEIQNYGGGIDRLYVKEI